MIRISKMSLCLVAGLAACLTNARMASAVQLVLSLVPADSHITIDSEFGGLPADAQEGVAGTTDLVATSPSTTTTFQGTITVEVDNILAPSSIQIISSAANADTSGVWYPEVQPYQDLNGDDDPGDFGLPPEGDSEPSTNTNFTPAAEADWGIKVHHPAFGVDVAFGAFRDVSYNITSAVEAVDGSGDFSSLTEHLEPDGFLDYWVAPGAGGLLGRTEANTGDGDFYDNTADVSSYTVSPLGGGTSQVTLFLPVLVDDMGDTLRTVYTGQFVATTTIIVPEPSTIAMVTFVGAFSMLWQRRRRQN
jgi:hypothetical protein